MAVERKSIAHKLDREGPFAGRPRRVLQGDLVKLHLRTLLTYEVEAQIGGKLAQLGQRLVNGVAKKMADEFFANLVKAVTAT